MTLPSPYWEELEDKGIFFQSLSPQDQRVLEMISYGDLTYKEIAARMRCSIKTVERVTNRIVTEYEKHYHRSHRTISFRKVLIDMAPYFYLRNLLNR